ncbi:MAG: T9SS type A sorting domain-containing protein, partial [Bacteroidota bacterium]
ESFNGQEIPLTVISRGFDAEGNTAAIDTFSYFEVLSCAIDPNDKQVLPARREPSNSNFTRFDETLLYTIRFQNTGTDTAFTVRIEDQLSPELDHSTFRPIAASHPYRVSIYDGGLVEFVFENIMLPDSNINESLSHGFVTFEIDFHPGVADFTRVENTAAIFFDFNSPVITNTVTNTAVAFLDQDQDGYFFWQECDDENEAINPSVEEIPNNGIDENCDGVDTPVNTIDQLSGRLAVYPNPTNDQLQISCSEAKILEYALFDLHGQIMLKGQFRTSVQLRLEQLPASIYFLRLVDPTTGAYTTRRISKF